MHWWKLCRSWELWNFCWGVTILTNNVASIWSTVEHPCSTKKHAILFWSQSGWLMSQDQNSQICNHKSNMHQMLTWACLKMVHFHQMTISNGKYMEFTITFGFIWCYLFSDKYNYWLVVLTILKNISQWEGLSHILWKIKMFETTNQANYWLLIRTIVGYFHIPWNQLWPDKSCQDSWT